MGNMGRSVYIVHPGEKYECAINLKQLALLI